MIERRRLLGGVVAAGIGLPAVACAAPAETEEARRLREDWPWLGRYAAENAERKAAGTRTDVAFMGDSITEGWRGKRPGFFPPNFLNRGISGQTTPQMVLRMMADIVAFRPRIVHIMGGTNDVASATGPISVAQTCDNLAMMVAIARQNDIRVLLASVPPADHYPWRPGLETAGPIRAINAWIGANAKGLGATFVDYTPALATGAGAMRDGYAFDGVHPTEAGYDAMVAVLTPFLVRAGVTGTPAS